MDKIWFLIRQWVDVIAGQIVPSNLNRLIAIQSGCLQFPFFANGLHFSNKEAQDVGLRCSWSSVTTILELFEQILEETCTITFFCGGFWRCHLVHINYVTVDTGRSTICVIVHLPLLSVYMKWCLSVTILVDKQKDTYVPLFLSKALDSCTTR